ncbi:MAG: PTS glucose transporter subunit IIA [Hespellia sp.]|nr:PTS glucose transporter subunit IIA [Hespellia sp.]
MFNFLKPKKKSFLVGSPVAGEAVPVSEVNDPTFSEGMLGKGVAVKPTDGNIYAPADGTIGLLFDTLHAVSIQTDTGAEILVHIGLDTVQLKGEGFTAHTATGDTVKKGDLLISVDLEKVKAAGYDVITPMLICNTDDFAAVDAITGKTVAAGDDVLEITEK